MGVLVKYNLLKFKVLEKDERSSVFQNVILKT